VAENQLRVWFFPSDWIGEYADVDHGHIANDTEERNEPDIGKKCLM
jgi:hypothetical protein